MTKMPQKNLYLPVNAFVFVKEPVILAIARTELQNLTRLILVKRERAGIGVRILVVVVELAALTARRAALRVFREIHITL